MPRVSFCYFGTDVADIAIRKRLDHALRMRHHHLSINRKLTVVEGGLYEAALLFPERAVTSEQAVAREGAEGALDQPGFVELLRLFNQDLAHQVGVVELIDAQRTLPVMGDIAVLARDPRRERQRIDRKERRKYLREDRDREVDSRAVRVRSFHPEGLGGSGLAFVDFLQAPDADGVAKARRDGFDGGACA